MNILVYPRFKAFKDDNSPAAGWKVLFYQAGTTTPQDAYSDSSLTVPIGQVELDGSGEADIWLDPSLSYKVVVTDENDVVQRTVDNINTLQDGKFSDIVGSTLAVSGAGSFGGQVTSTVATGTTPLVIASTTKVVNLNADLLDNQEWSRPGPIGSVTPDTGAFTSITASGNSSVSGISTVGSYRSLSGTHGEQWIQGQVTEELTLSTTGATTDSAANLLPANSIIEAVVARVTASITLAANWKIGDGTTSDRFLAAVTTLSAGDTALGIKQWDPAGVAAANGPQQSAAAKLRITCNANPGAGKVRVTVFYRQFILPTS